MPLYEYLCSDCSRRFEALVRSSDQTPSCPACASARVQKQLSVFAVGHGPAAVSANPAPCGTCGDPRGPGACSLN